MPDEWLCSTCGTVARFMPGFEPAGTLPNGWAKDGSGVLCLRCRWSAEVEAAGVDLEAAAAIGPKHAKRAKEIVRGHMIASELGRTPDDDDKTIARRLRGARLPISMVSANMVAERRAELDAEGAEARRAAAAETREAVERELRSNPARSNRAIAEAVDAEDRTIGAAESLTQRTRTRLEEAGEIETWRMQGGRKLVRIGVAT